MAAKIITVDLPQAAYDVYIGRDLIYRATDFLPDDVSGNAFFVVGDENTKSYTQNLATILLQEGARFVKTKILPPGEKTKSFDQTEKLCKWLLVNGVDRYSTVLAVGGGVIGDLAGFAAAITMRGLSCVQLPTTLLAQVDSSVGGKTGINTGEGKNLIGSFHQPRAVIVDIGTLKTLPERQIKAGYAEIVKYGLIQDAAFFEWLEKNGKKVCALEEEALIHAISKSVESKAKIVQQDEKETGSRALLNFGHTFGHALENAAGYDERLLHGEAVAIGMVMALQLSLQMKLCAPEVLERVEAHLLDVGLPTHVDFIEPVLQQDLKSFLKLMRRDKKSAGGQINYILLDEIGHAFVSRDVKEEDVQHILAHSFGNKHKGMKDQWKSTFTSQ